MHRCRRHPIERVGQHPQTADRPDATTGYVPVQVPLGKGIELRTQTTTFGQEVRALTITMILALVSAVLIMAALAFGLARFT